MQFDLIYPQAGIKDQGAVAQFTTIEYSTKQWPCTGQVIKWRQKKKMRKTN